MGAMGEEARDPGLETWARTGFRTLTWTFTLGTCLVPLARGLLLVRRRQSRQALGWIRFDLLAKAFDQQRRLGGGLSWRGPGR